MAPLELTVTEGVGAQGNKRICGDIGLGREMTLCPIKRYTKLATGTATSANTCPNIAHLKASVAAEAENFRQNVGENDNVDMFGNPILSAFSSNALGAGSEVIADVDAYQATITSQSRSSISATTTTTTNAIPGAQSQQSAQNSDLQTQNALAGLSSQDARQGVSAAGDGAFVVLEDTTSTTPAPTEIVKVKSSLAVVTQLSPDCSTEEQLNGDHVVCVALRKAMEKGIYEGISAVSSVRIKAEDVTITNVAIARRALLTGRRAQGKTSEKKRFLTTATLDTAYEVTLPPAPPGETGSSLGTSFAEQLSSQKETFETQMVTSMTAEIAADPNLDAEQFAVTGVTSNEVEVEVTVVTTTVPPVEALAEQIETSGGAQTGATGGQTLDDAGDGGDAGDAGDGADGGDAGDGGDGADGGDPSDGNNTDTGDGTSSGAVSMYNTPQSTLVFLLISFGLSLHFL